MEDFIVRNIGIISNIIGLIIFVFAINSFNLVEGTKFELIHKWYFILLVMVGVIVSSEAIGKWLIK